jgi:hypothetical protein
MEARARFELRAKWNIHVWRHNGRAAMSGLMLDEDGEEHPPPII